MSGLPSDVAITGTLKAGAATGEVKIEFSTMPPNQQLVSVDFTNLDFTDFLHLCEQATGWEIEKTSSVHTILLINRLYFYLSSGVTLHGTDYPFGARFTADIVLFDKHAKINAAISAEKLELEGSIDAFDIGPVKVQGVEDVAHPSFKFLVEPCRQYAKIDGVVMIGSDQVSCFLEIQTMPEIIFRLDLNIQFEDMLYIMLHAEKKDGSGTHPKLMDFELEVEVKDEILKHVNGVANRQLKQSHGMHTQAGLKRKADDARERFAVAMQKYETKKRETETKYATGLKKIAEETRKLEIERDERRDVYERKTGQLKTTLSRRTEETDKRIVQVKNQLRVLDTKARIEMERLEQERHMRATFMEQAFPGVAERLMVAEMILNGARGEYFC